MSQVYIFGTAGGEPDPILAHPHLDTSGAAKGPLHQ
jgi:hypothetical protein